MKNDLQKPFEDLVAVLAGHPGWNEPVLAHWAAHANDALAQQGLCLLAAWHFKRNNMKAVEHVLEGARRRFAARLPLPLVHLLISLFCLRGRTDEVHTLLLEYGMQAVQSGNPELAAEALNTALTLEGRRAPQILREPAAYLRAAQACEEIARSLPPVVASPATQTDSPRKLKIGLLVPYLAEHSSTYCHQVRQLANHLDATRFELVIYVSENMAPRPRQWHCWNTGLPTRERAPRLLAWLDRQGVPTYICSSATSFLEAAQLLAQKIADDGVDVLLLQSPPSMTIDWLAARLAPVSVKIQLHRGYSAYLPGCDYTLFNNPTSMEQEAAHWPAQAGDHLLMPRGVDLRELDEAPCFNRAALKLPREAILIGTSGNHFNDRLGEANLRALAHVLECRPQTHYVMIGVRDHGGRIHGFFRRRGLRDRVLFIPPQHMPIPFVKMLDIYAAPFPRGGAQDILEAMACRRPVAAMRCGKNYEENIGADLIGKPWAIERYDPMVYEHQLKRLVDDAALRSRMGAALRMRAERQFSAADFVRKLSELAAATWWRKQAHALQAQPILDAALA